MKDERGWWIAEFHHLGEEADSNSFNLSDMSVFAICLAVPQTSTSYVPDAIVWVVDAVGVAPEALPGQPAHRRRPRQPVVQGVDAAAPLSQGHRQEQCQPEEAGGGGGGPRCL